MIPSAPDSTVRFNPPPAWSTPAGFDPRRGHLTDPTWPVAPDGWAFWVVDPTRGPERANLPSATLPRGKLEAGERRRLIIIGACVVAAIVGTGWVAIATDDEVRSGVGSCWTGGTEWLEPVSCDSADADYVVEQRVGTPELCPSSSLGYLEDGDAILCLRPRD